MQKILSFPGAGDLIIPLGRSSQGAPRSVHGKGTYLCKHPGLKATTCDLFNGTTFGGTSLLLTACRCIRLSALKVNSIRGRDFVWPNVQHSYWISSNKETRIKMCLNESIITSVRGKVVCCIIDIVFQFCFTLR
jgi:hypothetical protein